MKKTVIIQSILYDLHFFCVPICTSNFVPREIFFVMPKIIILTLRIRQELYGIIQTATHAQQNPCAKKMVESASYIQSFHFIKKNKNKHAKVEYSFTTPFFFFFAAFKVQNMSRFVLYAFLKIQKATTHTRTHARTTTRTKPLSTHLQIATIQNAKSYQPKINEIIFRSKIRHIFFLIISLLPFQ